MPDSRHHAVYSTGRAPVVRLGFSEAAMRAAASGQVTICAQLVAGLGGVRLTGIRLALGACDRCATIGHTDSSATISGPDLLCQAVTP